MSSHRVARYIRKSQLKKRAQLHLISPCTCACATLNASASNVQVGHSHLHRIRAATNLSCLHAALHAFCRDAQQRGCIFSHSFTLSCVPASLYFAFFIFCFLYIYTTTFVVTFLSLLSITSVILYICHDRKDTFRRPL